jgi:DHA1 family multidrug resistance protein-like MFS transporter
MVAVLSAAFLFNLGQGVLRPAMPLYMQQVFAATYRMVTVIPTVFGAGKWVASLPTGYLLDRLGRRRLMLAGLLVIAGCDLGSVLVSSYGVFLGWRALAGIGWAMFATVATTAMVDTSAGRRGRRVSALLMSETSGLLLGSAAGGWLYQGIGTVTPFLFEAACMGAGAVVVGGWGPALSQPVTAAASRDRRELSAVLRTRRVVRMGATSAVLMAVQTGIVVFLFPLYLLERGHLAPATVGLLVSLGVLGRFVALWLAGGITDQAKRVRALALGLAAYATLLGSLAFIGQPLALGVWSLALGGAAGFVAPLPTAIVGDAVAASRQGLAIGWLRTMTDTGQMLGPLALGALADAGGLAMALLAGAALLAAIAWPDRAITPKTSAGT